MVNSYCLWLYMALEAGVEATVLKRMLQCHLEVGVDEERMNDDAQSWYQYERRPSTVC